MKDIFNMDEICYKKLEGNRQYKKILIIVTSYNEKGYKKIHL
jgi:hypothetical protein